MNKKMKTFCKLGAVVLLLSLCLTGCDNLFEPPAAKTNDGKGLVLFQFGPSGSRTAMPTTLVYPYFELSFTPINVNTGTAFSYTKQELEANLGAAVIPYGDWEVTADIYDNNTAAKIKIATGNKDITVDSPSQSETIELKFLVGVAIGTGILNYTITSTVTKTPIVAGMSFLNLGGGFVPAPITPLTLNSPGTPLTPDAGYYLVTVTLTAGTTEEAVKAEVVHIYAGQTTELEFDFANDDFHDIAVPSSDITYSVIADGSNNPGYPTTKITFTFSGDVSTLVTGEGAITLTPNTGTVNKGTWVEITPNDGTKFELPVNTFTSGASVGVSIPGITGLTAAPTSGSPVTLYNVPNITYTVIADGSNNPGDPTTKITFTFTGDVSTLVTGESAITLTPSTGTVAKGTWTAVTPGTVYELPVNTFTSGASVGVSIPGVTGLTAAPTSGSPVTLYNVPNITYTVIADGSSNLGDPTTKITFTFTGDVSTMVTNEGAIALTPSTGTVTKGAWTAVTPGTVYELPVSAFTSGASVGVSIPSVTGLTAAPTSGSPVILYDVTDPPISGSATITFTVTDLGNMAITGSPTTITGTETLTLSADLSGITTFNPPGDTVNWRVDGFDEGEGTDEGGGIYSFTIKADDYTDGNHSVFLQINVGGAFYSSQEATFTVN
jgi:hypothetical protein